MSFTKLDRENDPSDLWRTTQDGPRVLTSLVVTAPEMGAISDLLGVTCNQDEYPQCVAGKCCQDESGTLCDETSQCFDVPVARDSFRAYVRPSAVCIEDPTDPASKTVIVTPHVMDRQNTSPVISDEDATRSDIALQLSRDLDNVELVYGCLPPGEYALNVIYPSTGQAWTLPNESGICMQGEAPGDGTCGKRVRLDSQFRAFAFGAADDPGYCQAQRKPLNEPDPIRDFCLTAHEREMYIEGTLWGGAPNPL